MMSCLITHANYLCPYGTNSLMALKYLYVIKIGKNYIRNNVVTLKLSLSVKFTPPTDSVVLTIKHFYFHNYHPRSVLLVNIHVAPWRVVCTGDCDVIYISKDLRWCCPTRIQHRLHGVVHSLVLIITYCDKHCLKYFCKCHDVFVIMFLFLVPTIWHRSHWHSFENRHTHYCKHVTYYNVVLYAIYFRFEIRMKLLKKEIHVFSGRL